jgi:hypothetical protein
LILRGQDLGLDFFRNSGDPVVSVRSHVH